MPYLGGLAFRDSSWYLDCTEEREEGFRGEREEVSRDNNGKFFI